MADLFSWLSGSWRGAKNVWARRNSQWQQARNAWAWDGSNWVLVWAGEVIIDVTSSADLRQLFDASEYASFDPAPFRIIFRVDDSILGVSTSTPTIDVPNNWPWNPEIIVELGQYGRISGAGGDGGDGGTASDNGGPNNGPYTTDGGDGGDGGTALRTRYPIKLDNAGTIQAGGGGGGGGAAIVYGYTTMYPGGGGGGGAGGGGAGGGPGSPDFLAQSGVDGSIAFGGAGAPAEFDDDSTHGSNEAGDGGDPARNGQTGGTLDDLGYIDVFVSQPGSGGTKGTAVDGVSNVSFTRRGAIAGPEIN